MPRALARFFTASSNDFGTRMLSCAVFLSNSNCNRLNPERSYALKSAASTKRSAASSVLNAGIFFFIVFDLLPVHVPGSDGTDVGLSGALVQRLKHRSAGLENHPHPTLPYRG